MFDFEHINKRIKNLTTKNNSIIETLNYMGISLENISDNKNEVCFSTLKKELKQLKIACIMDKFTYESYRYECNLLELTPEKWMEEIEDFKPDLLFIESAWEGKNKLWYRKIANGSKEFFEMASFCHEKRIPVIFWNKEDPIYTDTFMPIARMANYIFTTDIDCIEKYKKELAHNNVYYLHFAAQPIIHNPIEKYERKDKFCFAGAYYHKYKTRSKVFDEFANIFISTKGFDIFDRNYKSSLPEHTFPKKYNNYILGRLEPSEIDLAYKGYYYGINMNSVNQSQTMFARRVFELLASNTITIGNYARGIKNLFGDLTICTNDSTEMQRQFDLYCKNEENSRKYRLQGLRKVLKEHLYEDRLDYIIKKVYGKSLKPELPVVVLFTAGENGVKSFQKQSYSNKILKNIKTKNDIMTYLNSISDEFESVFFGILNEKDFYGENYLLDLVLSLRFCQFDAICKEAYYIHENGKFILKNKELAYKKIDKINLSRGIININRFKNAKENYELLEANYILCLNSFSIDEFNYCENFTHDTCNIVEDLFIPDKGIETSKIYNAAEKIKCRQTINNGRKISGIELNKYIKRDILKKLTIKEQEKSLKILSICNENENEYLYFEKMYKIDEYSENKKLSLLFNSVGSTETLGVCVFFDLNKKKIEPAFIKSNRYSIIEVPQKAQYFKLGLRIRGEGNTFLKDISVGLEKNENEMSVFLSRSNVLVLTNQYPSYDNLYRNMFIHKRITMYKEDGIIYDVMKMNIYANDCFDEFEGINVVEGYCEKLENVLSTGEINTLCIHFLDKQMWDVIKNIGKQMRILVWLHGSEIQPWWRREYNYNSESELNKAKLDSETRMAFWKEIFSEYRKYNIKFIFVSKYFAEEIFEDNKVNLPEEDYYIIHNCIDTEKFKYIRKSDEQRKKILSIRPYASNKYANDLSVKAVMELSKKEFFQELEFLFVGNGELFDKILKPLKNMKNVTLIKTFLRQDEISKLHREYGIFLTPTRMDAQGVSRDEAMASGMVPITNAVTAIPEFVDNSCGILVEGEDYKGIAEGIERLYFDSEEFLRLSENAADRVRKQTSKKFTINKEEDLINNKI